MSLGKAPISCMTANSTTQGSRLAERTQFLVAISMIVVTAPGVLLRRSAQPLAHRAA